MEAISASADSLPIVQPSHTQRPLAGVIYLPDNSDTQRQGLALRMQNVIDGKSLMRLWNRDIYSNSYQYCTARILPPLPAHSSWFEESGPLPTVVSSQKPENG